MAAYDVMQQQVVLPCLHTITRGEALELEAAAASSIAAQGAGGGGKKKKGKGKSKKQKKSLVVGFNCSICNHLCTTRASELIVDAVAQKAAAAPSKKRKKCDCEEEDATVYCQQCKTVSCDACFENSHSKGARKLHTKIPIAEHMAGGGGSAGGAAAGRPKVMCAIHTEYPLMFFCRQRNKPICAMCVAIDPSKTDYVELSEAFGSSKEEIQGAASRASNVLVEVSDGIKAVDERRTEVEKSKDATHQEVQRSYKKVQVGLIAQMKAVQQDTLAEGKRKVDVLDNQKDALETAKERLESGLELATRMQEGASEVELLQIKQVLVNGLTVASSHGVAVQPLCGPSVTFVQTPELLALIEKMPALGAISGSDVKPAACTAVGEGLQDDVLVGNEVAFVVTAFDFQGVQRTTGGDAVAMSVAAGGGGGSGGGGAAGALSLETAVVDHNNGMYACRYSLPEGTPEGDYQLSVLVLGQHIQGSPFAVRASVSKRFVHTSTFDQNGVLYWIGTGGGTKAYENPHGKPGGVVAKKSSDCNSSNADAERFVDNAELDNSSYCYTNDIANSWMSVDLGAGRRLAPDYYCLRHWTFWTSNQVLRNWRLEGSNDGSTWTTLKTHANDKAMAEHPASTASWPIQTTSASYRYFRILQTGKNSSSNNHLMCNGIELYGVLQESK